MNLVIYVNKSDWNAGSKLIIAVSVSEAFLIASSSLSILVLIIAWITSTLLAKYYARSSETSARISIPMLPDVSVTKLKLFWIAKF